MTENQAYPDSMNRLIDQFARLPGIGRRTAERLAFHILKTDPADALPLAEAITDVKQNVHHCSRCFNLTEADPCRICADSRRDQREILVVEEPKDVISLEATGAYRGVYHVLGGHIAPLDGVGAEDLTIEALIRRVEDLANSVEQDDEGPVEVILGTNPNLEGDGTALVIAERLGRHPGVRVTRLARGLPAGTQLDYANKAVLSDAIVSRQPLR